MGRGFGGLMKTKDGGWIRLTSFSPRAIDHLRRRLAVEEIEEGMVEKMVAEMKRDEAVDFFVKADVPVAPIYYIEEVVKDPHLAARGMFLEVEHPKAGRVKVTNFPVKFSETPGEILSAAPLLGQHNREILMGILGYTEEKIIELEKTGVIVTET